jgi:tetratricopeptide (TPR) repeat protein
MNRMNTVHTKRDPSHRAGFRRRVLGALFLAGLTLASYSNSLHNEFVFDDVKLIEENESIRSVRGIPRIFSHIFTYKPLEKRGHRIDQGYRPVRFISYVLDYQLFGPRPEGFRAMNMVYHLLNCLLVFFLARRLSGSERTGWAAACLFAIHPLQTESVTYLSGRRDVLYALFYLCGLLAVCRGPLKFEASAGLGGTQVPQELASRPRRGAFARSATCFVAFLLALFTKEMAITLPGVLLLYDVIRTREGGTVRRVLRSLKGRAGLYSALFTAGLAFAAFKVFWKNPGGHGTEAVRYWGGSFWRSILTTGRAVATYIRLVLYPVNLSVDYSFDAFPVSRSLIQPPGTILSLLLIGLILAAALWLFRRNKKAMAFSVGWFFIVLLPACQIVPHPERMAEHNLYLSLFGFCLLSALLLERLRSAGWHRIASGLLVIVVLAYGIRTYYRNRDWRDSYHLWGSAARVHPRCARAQLSFGLECLARGENAKARDAFDACLSVLPRPLGRGSEEGWTSGDLRIRGMGLSALFSLGVAQAKLGRYENALKTFRRVRRERDTFGRPIEGLPEYVHLHFNLGGVLKALGRWDEALKEYRTVLALSRLTQQNGTDSGNRWETMVRESLLGAGEVCEAMGRPEKARSYYSRAAGVPPARPETERAFYLLGMFHLRRGEISDAIHAFQAITRTHPESKEAHYRIADAYNRLGKRESARGALKRCLEIEPTFLPARLSLAILQFNGNELEDAEKNFRWILETRPDHKLSRRYLVAIAVRRAEREKRKLRDTSHRTGLEQAKLLLQLARKNLRKGDREGALTALTQAVALRPDFAEAHYTMGLAYAEMGNSEKAADAYHRALSAEPGLLKCHEMLARLYLHNRDFRRAEQELLQYIEKAGESSYLARIHTLLARAYHKDGRLAEAETQYREALRKGAGYPPALAELGALLKKMNRSREAAGFYRRYLELLPNGPRADDARKALKELSGSGGDRSGGQR